MEVYTIEEIARRVAPIARRYNIPALYLFGSYARGTAVGHSDIDILVDTTGSNLDDLFEMGALYCDLQEALGKNIDLVTLNAIKQKAQMPSEIDFKENVMREKVCVYEAA